MDFICRLRVDEIDMGIMGEGQIASILCYHTTVINVKVFKFRYADSQTCEKAHSSLIAYIVENYEKSGGLNHEVFFGFGDHRLYRLLLLA